MTKKKNTPINLLYRGKTVKEFIPNWSSLPWVGMNSNSNQKTPNPQTAVVKSVELFGGRLNMNVEDNENQFQTPLPGIDPVFHSMMLVALLKAINKTLEDAGAEKL